MLIDLSQYVNEDRDLEVGISDQEEESPAK